MNRLVKRAKEMRGANSMNRITKENIPLAVSWAKGEVSLTAVATVMDIPPQNKTGIYSFLARALREEINKK